MGHQVLDRKLAVTLCTHIPPYNFGGPFKLLNKTLNCSTTYERGTNEFKKLLEIS